MAIGLRPTRYYLMWKIPTSNKYLDVGDQVSVRTGIGFVVIDVDKEEVPSYIESTRTVKTPNGWHFYYLYDGPVRSGPIDKLVEVRGDYSWVVCPPSRGYLLWNAQRIQPLPNAIETMLSHSLIIDTTTLQNRIKYFNTHRITP